MDKAKKNVDFVLEKVCMLLFAFMTVVGTYQIVTRYIFNAPSTKSEELLTYSFTWLSLLAAAYVFGKMDHMKMVFLVNKFPDNVQKIFAIAGEVITIIFSVCVLLYGGISITKLTMTQQSASLKVPMGYIYSVIPVTGAITVFYNITNIYNLIKQIKKG